ncbi:putative ABC transporter permease [Bifidobacterium leontopitheci]|uniref:Transporter n=1 Tax=Bifidobacterium leontopitheci TaxID=2650774 RepID=A0A6I1GH50_9BIFI|nr:putative ABC transporter permease [Bifidobacterium leontopitheci]KAB7790945.1 transporter [Bifidobacterium leontopitheci]
MLLLEKLFLWFLFYSFVGWVYESILVSFLEHRPVNRGFLNGPLCPIYGSGAVLAVVLLQPLGNPVLIFLASMIGASVLEYVTSWVMEQLFHARWWDYSDYRFNLNGRICLLGACIFGVGGVVITKLIHPYVAGVTDMIPVTAIHWMCAVFFVAGLVDLIVTVCGILHFETSLEKILAVMTRYGGMMREAVDGAAGRVGESWNSGKEMSLDFMTHVRDAAVETFNRQQRRMIASFPKLRTDRNNEVLKQLRRVFENLHGRK